jgi:Ni,Fe-hydrogenase I cytochrome b subunit
MAYLLSELHRDSPYGGARLAATTTTESSLTSESATIKTIDAEMAYPSFDHFFGFILVVMMLFSIYTVSAFVKARVQARKRIQLPVTTQA